jgi:hypothetical protein
MLIIFLYVVDSIIIISVLYACCSKYDLKEEEEEFDIENQNYLSFYNEE